MWMMIRVTSSCGKGRSCDMMSSPNFSNGTLLRTADRRLFFAIAVRFEEVGVHWCRRVAVKVVKGPNGSCIGLQG